MLRYHSRRILRRTASKLALLSGRFERLLPTANSFRRHEHHWSSQPERLVLLLPGIDDIPEDFIRRGFVTDIEQHGLGSGAVALDAHYGYYASRSLHRMLEDDVMRPARARGYRQFMMVGVSLGGFGAITYAQRRPEDIAALLLLAPYLGGRDIVREIRQAGGVREWDPGQPNEHDYERQLWKWIKQEYAQGGRDPRIPLYLGYGKGDWMADAHHLLASVLPPERLFVIPGRHNWKTWTALWPRLLASIRRDGAKHEKA